MLVSMNACVRASAVGLCLAFAAGCGGSSSSGTAAGGASTGGSAAGGAGGGGPGGTGASGGTGEDGGLGGGAGQACLASKYDGLVVVDYELFNPVFNTQCAGSNHQDIQNVERLVFLGDSITVGTPPTPGSQVYRSLLTEKAKAKWPSVAIASCAVNGAKTDDFFAGDNQISKCFPGVETKKTLVVITMGGNDIKDLASAKAGADEASAGADVILANMRKAVTWLKDPANFPNGSYVVFANIYEYTDLTGELGSCPTASFIGLSGDWHTGMAALAKLREGYMKIAVDTQSDMTFMGELFCGHGFNFDDPNQQCYEPGSSNWFDITCIHPTPEGHAQIADQFWAAIEE